MEKLADAHRQRVVLEAEAEAEAIRLNGEAQAFAIEAKAKAEAEQMSKKAAAFKEYREAAMVDMLLNTLPKVSLMNRSFPTYINFSPSVLFLLDCLVNIAKRRRFQVLVDLIFKLFWCNSHFFLNRRRPHNNNWKGKVGHRM